MKAIKQTERKSLVIHYQRAEAVARSHSVQAFFGLLTEDLTSTNGHFITADLDDEFFRSLDVDVELMAALEPFGLRSVAVSLDYGDINDPRSHRHDDLIFDSASPQRQRWVVPIGPTFDLTYRPRIEYHFDPTSDWNGETNEIVIEPGPVTDRTLQLDPTAHVGFLHVEVVPDGLDASDARSVEVELLHESSTGWTTRKTFVVAPDSPAQHWRVRTASKDERSYSVKRTYHLSDGGSIELPFVTSSATRVAVTSPLAGALNRRFDFTVPNSTFDSVILDLRYDDAEHGYGLTRRFELDGSNLGTTRAEFGIVNPLFKTTTVQATLIGADGSIVRGGPFEGEAEFLSVGVDGEITGT